MDTSDYKKIDSFYPKGWITPKIDWFLLGDGIPMNQLSNVFDDENDKQNRQK